MVKCSEVLQCSDGLTNKAFDIIRRRIESMKLLLVILQILFVINVPRIYVCIPV